MAKNIIEGNNVRFYDCQTANAEKDYSGTNPKHFPIGKIIRIYEYKSFYGYTDTVCDIQVGDRISKGHFVSGVDLLN